MAISNCLFSPTSENPCGFSAWCVLAEFIAKFTQLLIAQPLVAIRKKKPYQTIEKLPNDNNIEKLAE